MIEFILLAQLTTATPSDNIQVYSWEQKPPTRYVPDYQKPYNGPPPCSPPNDGEEELFESNK